MNMHIIFEVQNLTLNIRFFLVLTDDDFVNILLRILYLAVVTYVTYVRRSQTLALMHIAW